MAKKSSKASSPSWRTLMRRAGAMPEGPKSEALRKRAAQMRKAERAEAKVKTKLDAMHPETTAKPRGSKKPTRSQIMKAAWKKRKRAAALAELLKTPTAWEVGHGKDADEITVNAANHEAAKIAQSLEAELARRDKELIAEFQAAIADTTRIISRTVSVPWSTIDAILRSLPKS